MDGSVPSAERLIAVLREAQRLLSLDANEFVWSSWKDAGAATAELQRHIELLAAGDRSRWAEMCALFGPTGPIQEVGVSSGWADEFLELAARFDRESSEPAVAPPSPPRPPRTWRPMALWTAGILLALGMAWFVGAVVVPYFRIRAFMTGGGPGREDVIRLGGPERAARRIVWYLRLPRAVAPLDANALWQLAELRQHAVPCLVQCMKKDGAGSRGLVVYLLGQALVDSVQKAEWEDAEPDMDPRVLDDGILALASALRDSDKDVRYAAATELGWIGPRAAPAIPALERLASESGGDELMRLIALEALESIRPGKAP